MFSSLVIIYIPLQLNLLRLQNLGNKYYAKSQSLTIIVMIQNSYHGNYSNGFSLEKTENIWSIEYTIKSWDIGITVIKKMGHNCTIPLLRPGIICTFAYCCMTLLAEELKCQGPTQRKK